MAESGMITITIRNVPTGTRDVLAARAATSGRSLQEFLLRELEGLAARPSPGEVMERIRARKRAVPLHLDADELVDHLHADRR